jgi:excisionase family DNA binding protein
MSKIIVIDYEEFQEAINSLKSEIASLKNILLKTNQPELKADDEIISGVPNAAKLLGCSPATLWNMIKKGELTPYRSGAKLAFKKSELLRDYLK